MSALPHRTPKPGDPGPAWEIALLFPEQGEWSEESYLNATAGHARLIELVDGRIEILEMPTLQHQRIVMFIFRVLDRLIAALGRGEVLVAPTYVRVRKDTIREPDVFWLSHQRAARSDRIANAADLAVEVVSPDPASVKRDWVEKREDYARAGIPEYWIVDPQKKVIVVLTLSEGGGEYETQGEFGPGDIAKSKILDGFELDVDAVFAAANGPSSR